MTVVFATYQSIDVVAEAQRLGVGGFDLVICDEAHRTTGVTLAGQDESHFVKVHDGDYLKADRRLYMTATPRVFGDAVRKKATDAEAVLADMGDETVFGPSCTASGSATRSRPTCSPTTRCSSCPWTSPTSPRTSSRRWPSPARSRWATRPS